MPGNTFRPLHLRLALLVLGLLVCLAYLRAEVWLLHGELGFPLDDSWIHLQFARNLAEGHGLSYNPGELITGSTAPLWTALLALLFFLPGSVVAWAKALGVLLYLASIDASFRLGRELGLAPGFAFFAALLVLATSWMPWSALSGMEIPLFMLLSLWGMILHLRERDAPHRPPLSLPLLALGVLARPEGILLLLLAFADRCLVARRRPSTAPPEGAASEGAADAEIALQSPSWRNLLLGAGLAALALAGPLLFYRWAGGSVLPTTYAAKGGGLRHWLPSLKYVYSILGIFLAPQPYMTLSAWAGALALLARLGGRRDRGLLPALWVFVLPLAYSTLSPEDRHLIAGNFGRYYFPMFPPLVLLGVLGIELAARNLAAVWVGASRLPVRLAAAVLILWPTVTGLVQGEFFYAHNCADVQSSDVRVARWLAARLPPEAVLAVNDIGALKFFLPNRIVDLAGIANPELRQEVAHAMARGTSWDRAMADAIAERRADYVVIFPTWIPALASDPRFHAIFGLRIPDNITMGGPSISVYATAWTRYPLRRLPGDP